LSLPLYATARSVAGKGGSGLGGTAVREPPAGFYLHHKTLQAITMRFEVISMNTGFRSTVALMRGLYVHVLGPGVLLALCMACTDPVLPLDAGEVPPPQGPTDPAPGPRDPGPPGGGDVPLPPGPGEPAPDPAPEPVPGPTEIYIADADGSKLRFLVTGERPAWSPDGRRIAFQRGGNVHVIGADGTGEALLGEGREPSWAPDGARLAFVGSEGIAVMRDDGSEAVTLVRHDFREDTYVDDMGVGKPSWSPDGERIAFEHLGDGDLVPAQIFVMKADGSEPRRVTPTQGVQYAESDPAWSPDGSEIVLWSYGYGIAAVPAAGGKPRPIYQNFPAVAYGAKPVWSPDGNTILFTANRFRSQPPAIWVVPAQGGPAQPFIEEAADPAWSPDGARIAFGRTAVGSSRSRLAQSITRRERGRDQPRPPERTRPQRR
jgi:dipeptidyl aminopeptidase/acylaminoacyl peptidase